MRMSSLISSLKLYEKKESKHFCNFLLTTTRDIMCLMCITLLGVRFYLSWGSLRTFQVLTDTRFRTVEPLLENPNVTLNVFLELLLIHPIGNIYLIVVTRHASRTRKARRPIKVDRKLYWKRYSSARGVPWCARACDVHLLGKTLGIRGSWKYRPAVLYSLFSGILIGQIERSYLIGKDCVTLNAYIGVNVI